MLCQSLLVTSPNIHSLFLLSNKSSKFYLSSLQQSVKDHVSQLLYGYVWPCSYILLHEMWPQALCGLWRSPWFSPASLGNSLQSIRIEALLGRVIPGQWDSGKLTLQWERQMANTGDALLNCPQLPREAWQFTWSYGTPLQQNSPSKGGRETSVTASILSQTSCFSNFDPWDTTSYFLSCLYHCWGSLGEGQILPLMVWGFIWAQKWGEVSEPLWVPELLSSSVVGTIEAVMQPAFTSETVEIASLGEEVIE